MQETKHNITGNLRQEFFEAEKGSLLKQLMDNRLIELKDETLVRRIKIGRNDPCPCGSKRKFKKCCIHKVNKHA